MTPRIGFITVMSPIEAEADKAEERMSIAINNIKRHSVELIHIDSVVSSQVEAVKAAEKLGKDKIDVLTILVANWTSDAVILSAINDLDVPVLLWSIPSPATFSLPNVIHAASILKETGKKYKFIYGEPSDPEVARQVVDYAEVASTISMLKNASIGLLGPRPSWRMTGPTDTTYDEIDFTRTFGCEIIHIDINVLKSEVNKISDQEAERTLKKMKNEGRVGNPEVKENVLLEMAKNYLAIKNIMSKFNLKGMAVQCYPEYLGTVCLPASWCADEGIVVGCEGDIGTTIVSLILRELGGQPAAIIEPFMIDEPENRILIGHPCGSCAVSLADSISKVYLRPFEPDKGVFVHFPIKSGPVTLANVSGRGGTYKMFIGTGESREMTSNEWSKIGGFLAANIQFKGDIKTILDKVIQQEGIDHHWTLIFGDYKNKLVKFCDILNIRPVLV